MLHQTRADPAGKGGAGIDLLAGDLFPDTEFHHTAQLIARRHLVTLNYAQLILSLLRGGRDDR